MNIAPVHFEQADLSHEKTIFQWLNKPHVREFGGIPHIKMVKKLIP